MLLYVVCTAGEFVWNEGGVVQLPAPYITLCDIFYQLNSRNMSHNAGKIRLEVGGTEFDHCGG